jgi:hypothetical protein
MRSCWLHFTRISRSRRSLLFLILIMLLILILFVFWPGLFRLRGAPSGDGRGEKPRKAIKIKSMIKIKIIQTRDRSGPGHSQIRAKSSVLARIPP